MFLKDYCVRSIGGGASPDEPYRWKARVMEHGSATVAFAVTREMLQQAVKLLPKGVIGDIAGRPRFCPQGFNESLNHPMGLALSNSIEKEHLDLAKRKRLVSAQRFSLS